MTITQYKQMTDLACKLSIEELKIQIVKLMDDDADHVGDVFIAMLSALEAKIPEAEYVAFCDSI